MIDRYDFVIYPCKLWVCTDFEEAKKRFRYEDNNKEIESLSNDCLAVTYGLLKEKRTKDLGFAVVVVSNLKNLGGSKVVEIISHEASHIANRIFDWLGIHLDANNDEPYAYLLGYITSCIWKTVSKIIWKENNNSLNNNKK